jgi:hypothetical protein
MVRPLVNRRKGFISILPSPPKLVSRWPLSWAFASAYRAGLQISKRSNSPTSTAWFVISASVAISSGMVRRPAASSFHAGGKTSNHAFQSGFLAMSCMASISARNLAQASGGKTRKQVPPMFGPNDQRELDGILGPPAKWHRQPPLVVQAVAVNQAVGHIADGFVRHFL